jgi:hypothetical protein
LCLLPHEESHPHWWQKRLGSCSWQCLYKLWAIDKILWVSGLMMMSKGASGGIHLWGSKCIHKSLWDGAANIATC